MKRRKIIRRCDRSYLSFGFSWTRTEGEPRPQCVMCAPILFDESINPSISNDILQPKEIIQVLIKTRIFMECGIRRRLEYRLKCVLAGKCSRTTTQVVQIIICLLYNWIDKLPIVLRYLVSSCCLVFWSRINSTIHYKCYLGLTRP